MKRQIILGLFVLICAFLAYPLIRRAYFLSDPKELPKFYGIYTLAAGDATCRKVIGFTKYPPSYRTDCSEFMGSSDFLFCTERVNKGWEGCGSITDGGCRNWRREYYEYDAHTFTFLRGKEIWGEPKLRIVYDFSQAPKLLVTRDLSFPKGTLKEKCEYILLRNVTDLQRDREIFRINREYFENEKGEL